jgi:hypothetical protein
LLANIVLASLREPIDEDAMYLAIRPKYFGATNNIVPRPSERRSYAIQAACRKITWVDAARRDILNLPENGLQGGT